MLKDREKLYQIYHTILSMALNLACILTINQFFHLKASIAYTTLLSFITALLIYLFDQNRRNAISYLLLACVIPVSGAIFWIMKVNPVRWFMDILHWCWIYDRTDEMYVKYQANFVVLGVICMGAILFYLITKNQTAKLVLAFLLIAAMIVLSVNKYEINKAVVAIGIFYGLSILIEFYGAYYNKKAGRQEKREGILYLAPVCLILAILSISLPSKPEPIQWEGVKNLYRNVKEQIDNWVTEWEYFLHPVDRVFGVSMTGYSDDGGDLRSGGEVKKDSTVALKVTGAKYSSSMYLIGAVSNEYTGHSWEKTAKDPELSTQDYLLDYSELIYALSCQDPEVLRENRFIERRNYQIYYNNIKTKTCFYPIKTTWIQMRSDHSYPSAMLPNMTFSKAYGKGLSYEETYYDMNLNGEAFQQMLRDADGFSYDNAVEPSKESYELIEDQMIKADNIEVITPEDGLFDLLGKRAEWIRKEYTGLPSSLPNRVKLLAEDITADCETDYDKLRAIEKFLQGYQYTLHPQKVPKNRDFIDYFLFESKEGYCTSFATAMAVLGRCVGIPTRYVEGFIVKFSEKGDDNLFPVKNSQAHAWAEAYIEGVGWIPFEATASFYTVRYVKWKDLPKEGTQVRATYEVPYDEAYIRSLMNQSQEVTIDLTSEKYLNNNDEIIEAVIIFAAAIVVLILFVIMAFLILKLNYKKTYQKSDRNKKMYILFTRILRLLKQEGFTLEPDETIRMLSNRVRDIYHYETVTFKDVADIFMRHRYAGEAISEKDLYKVDVFYHGLFNMYRAEHKRFQVWIEEFIFLAKKSYR
jgi:hypothetical protein